VFHSKKNEWGIFEAGRFGVPLRVRNAGASIRQETAQAVAWHNHNANVEAPVTECGGQMDHVHHEKIGTCGHLHFNADAYARTVHVVAFDPIDIAGGLLCPAASSGEPSIQEFTNSRAAIRIDLFFHQESEALDNLFYLINEGTETKPFCAIFGSVVVDLFDDFRHG